MPDDLAQFVLDVMNQHKKLVTWACACGTDFHDTDTHRAHLTAVLENAFTQRATDA